MAERFADRTLAARVEAFQAWGDAAYAATLRSRSPESVAATLAVGGGVAVRTGPAFPVNRAIGLGFGAPVRGADLDALEAFYAAVGLPPEVEICPLADPSLLAELGRRGYRAYRFMNTYTLPLGAHLGMEREPPAPGVVARAATAAEADLWEAVAAGEDAVTGGMAQQLTRACWERPGVTGYLAWVDGEPAAAGALVIHDGLAGLFFMVTRAAFRRRGAQAALLAARLAHAQAAGCELAVVNSVPGVASQRNIQRAGFAVAYTKVFLIHD